MESETRSLGLMPSQARTKRKRTTLTINQKLEILKRLDLGETANAVAESYNIGISTLYDLKAQRTDLIEYSEANEDGLQRKNLRKSKFPELDDAVFKWFKQQQSDGKTPSRSQVIQKAKELYVDMKIDDDECTFSVGWLNRFKDRHGIQKFGSPDNNVTTDSDTAAKCICTFSNLIQENNFSSEQIFNAGETELAWRSLPPMSTKHNQNFEDEDLVTVFFCVNAAGYKCTPLVIIKNSSPLAFRDVDNPSVIYGSSENGWMTEDILQNWINNYFKNDLSNYFSLYVSKNGLTEYDPALLVLDNCKYYPEAEVIMLDNISIQYLSPNIKNLIQPLDQGIIRTVKKLYRINFIEHLISNEAEVNNIADLCKSYSLDKAMCDLAAAWQCVHTETILKSWKKLWPNIVIEETDEAEDSQVKTTNDLKELAKSSKFFKDVPDEVWDEWIDMNDDAPVSYDIPDDALVECVLDPPTVAKYSEADVDTCSVKRSFTNALKAVKVLINFCESHPNYLKEEVEKMNIYQLRTKILEDKHQFMKLLKQKQKPSNEFQNETECMPVFRPGTSSGDQIESSS